MSFIEYPPSYPFICPAIRTQDPQLKLQWKCISKTSFLIIDNSYHENEISSNCHISYFGDKKVIHSHYLRLLLGCNNKEGQQSDLYCIACKSDKIGTTYYYCNYCIKPYHKECVESPPILISSYYPKYPFQLLSYSYSYGNSERECHSCGLRTQGLVYYSSTCDLFLDPVCTRKREFSAISNQKRHEHILHYFPRKASLTCDVCASDDDKVCFYTCHQCDFIVHRRCINLPRVILISCHNHRLSFTNTLPFENWPCGVCRKKIDENYGSYSCSKSCTYAVHTKCAILVDVWAGKELEDEPEMVYDDIEPFEEIGDGIIRYFSHAQHPMRLIEDTEKLFDAKQQNCQACILPLYDDNVYTCMECNFVLHEKCANLPRIKHVVVHDHRLTLEPIYTEGFFRCGICHRYSCGFRYMCREACSIYNLDVRCASLSELVDHPSHPHPLFLFYEPSGITQCSTCERLQHRSLSCVECDFLLCPRCANLPYKIKYEHDEHMLTLSYDKNASSLCWCQICEETTYPKEGYYRCNECIVTFHTECILGDDLYLKEGQIPTDQGLEIEIIPNNRLSRPICNGCQKRCQDKLVFKTSQGYIYCSSMEILDNTY